MARILLTFVVIVDRILRQQKAAKQAAEDSTKARNLAAISEALGDNRSEIEPLLSSPSPKTASSPLPGAGPQFQPMIPQSTLQEQGEQLGSRPTSAIQNWKRKIGSAIHAPQSDRPGVEQAPSVSVQSMLDKPLPVPGSSRTNSGQRNGHSITPLSQICKI